MIEITITQKQDLCYKSYYGTLQTNASIIKLFSLKHRESLNSGSKKQLWLIEPTRSDDITNSSFPEACFMQTNF